MERGESDGSPIITVQPKVLREIRCQTSRGRGSANVLNVEVVCIGPVKLSTKAKGANPARTSRAREGEEGVHVPLDPGLGDCRTMHRRQGGGRLHLHDCGT
jgi:hypothetical protein